MTPEHDEISGQHTTGHEWDGIKELDTPMPRAIRIWLWASIAVCLPLWLLYPSFPGISGYLGGMLGYSSRVAVTEAVAEGDALRAETFARFQQQDLAELAQDAALRTRFEPQIAVLFRDNCAACHGRDAMGQPGFPNLVDDHWLWSGLPEEIEYTITAGINSPHNDSRLAAMPAIGRDQWLTGDEIDDVIEYVLAISGQDHAAPAAARGATLFADNCSSCHADGGVGGWENGAPNLTDTAWIYGGDRETLAQTLHYGREGVMPAWSSRLSETEIRQLTVYLLWLGQDHADE